MNQSAQLNESTANLIKDFEDNKEDTFKKHDGLDKNKYAFGTNKILPTEHKYSKWNTSKINPFLVDAKGNDDLSVSDPKAFMKRQATAMFEKKIDYIKGDANLGYLKDQQHVVEFLDSDSNFFSESGTAFRGLHSVFSVMSFSDPYNPAIIRICILFIRIMGYAFFQSFLYSKNVLKIDKFAAMNEFVRGCLVYPGITIVLNMILIWFLELLFLKKVHWIYYHYFLFLAQNEDVDEEFEEEVLLKSRKHLVKRVIVVIFINLFFVLKLTGEAFREDFSENNYLVIGGLVSVLIDLGIIENFRVCFAIDQILKGQRHYTEFKVMKKNQKF